jgi:hypothetical protein
MDSTELVERQPVPAVTGDADALFCQTGERIGKGKAESQQLAQEDRTRDNGHVLKETAHRLVRERGGLDCRQVAFPQQLMDRPIDAGRYEYQGASRLFALRPNRGDVGRRQTLDV